jgi:hypothetical protein
MQGVDVLRKPGLNPMLKISTDAQIQHLDEASAPQSRQDSVSKETSPLDSVIGTIVLFFLIP